MTLPIANEMPRANAHARRPWRMIMPLGVVILLAIAWCIYWTVASRIVKSEVEDHIAALPQSGVTFECSQTAWAGFPFRFERECANPHVRTSEIDITARRMLAVMQAYDYRHVVALIDGPTEIAPALRVTHERAMASVSYSGDGAIQASIELPDLSVPGIGTAKTLLLHARDRNTGLIDVASSGETLVVRFPQNVTLALDRMRFAASVPAEALSRDWAQILARLGKTVTVSDLHLEKDGLVMDASGEIGIDAQGRIEGRLATRANDIDRLMAKIQELFRVSKGDLQAARAMISLMQPKKDGTVALDLIAKDGNLYWGPVMVGRLAPVF
ncbi:MAG: DUF2125 domain-containing protein [Parvibaculaceae bacterium]